MTSTAERQAGRTIGNRWGRAGGLQRLAPFTAIFHNVSYRTRRCRRKIEMSPGVQSKDDTPVAADTASTDIEAQLHTGSGLCYYCR